MSKTENQELIFTATRSINRTSIERHANTKAKSYDGVFHIKTSSKKRVNRPANERSSLQEFTFG